MMIRLYYQTSGRAGEIVFAEFTPLVAEFLSMFGEVGSGVVRMRGLYYATPDLKAEVANFCSTHARQNLKVNAFAKLIRDLRDGEAFLLLQRPPETTPAKLAHEVVLAGLNGEIALGDVYAQNELFGPLLAEYDICSPDTSRHFVTGNHARGDRRCRFCHLDEAEGATFAKVAHAISAALGNRYLKLADECDDCNGFFGDELEPHLIALLDIPRVLLGIKARGGAPVIQLDGWRMYHDGKRVVIEPLEDTWDRQANVSPERKVAASAGTSPEIVFTAASNVAIIPERVYRALVKAALSVIDEEILLELGTMVDWVRHGRKPEGGSLPLVRYGIVELPPDPSAQITLYVRRSERSRLPHIVGEFRFGYHLFVFLLPFSGLDEVEPAFVGDTEFDSMFRHYTAVGSWLTLDLGDATRPLGPTQLRLVGR